MEKAAIYCRLSKEDQDKINQGDESASIQNQKLLLVDYALVNHFDIYGIYQDDDYSGLDSERPDFKRIIKDAKNGCFSTIICKTLARFTRDMELVEKYIHGLFPLIGIRFIGVVDHVDTNVKGNKKARQINGLINEWYCEDLSENIRSVFRTKMEKGQFLGSYAPYGYKKDPNDSHRLIIDEEAATVVKNIFSYYVQGYSILKISEQLYQDNVPTPYMYKKQKGYNYQHPKKDNPYGKLGLWGKSTILRILSDRVYIGDMVQGKERKESYKSKKVKSVPAVEWIIVPDCHEPIIDKDTFELVQKLRKSRRYYKGLKESGTKEIPLLAGKVKCKDCGSTMTKIKGHGEDCYLYCQIYRRTRREKCSPHSIKYSTLLKVISEKIRSKICSCDDQAILINTLLLETDNKKLLLNKRNADLIRNKAKSDKIKKAISTLYIEKANGQVSHKEYMELKASLSMELDEISKKIEELGTVISILNNNQLEGNNQNVIQELSDFNSLNHNMINEFIDYIEIGEKDADTQEVIIHWQF